MARIKALSTMFKETLGADTVSFLKNGNYAARWEFYYTRGRKSEDYAKRVKSLIPNAIIIVHKEVWKAFKGGANTANSSHFYVEFKLI